MTVRWRLSVLLVTVGALGALLVPSAASSTQSGPLALAFHDPASGRWHLRDGAGGATAFFFGNPGDAAFVGDWDCDGVDTPGLYRRSDGYVYLRNSNTQGVADVRFFFGNPGDLPLAGDFDGDGCDTVSLYRPGQSMVFIIDELGSEGRGLGVADARFPLGAPGDVPFVGDFDGDGRDTVGIHRASSGAVALLERNEAGSPEVSFGFGDPGDVVLSVGPQRRAVAAHRVSEHRLFVRDPASGRIAATPVTAPHDWVVMGGSFGTLLVSSDPAVDPALFGFTITPRADWGARPAGPGMTPHELDRITVHHAGAHEGTTGPARFRAWQAWHMEGRGWPDLSYHYVIGIDGTVYEGRSPQYRTDTATGYDTTGHLQIVVEGNFEVDHPTEAQLDSLATVLAWAAVAFAIDPATVAGHRDHGASVCPGAQLYALLADGSIDSAVASRLGD